MYDIIEKIKSNVTYTQKKLKSISYKHFKLVTY
jgi:hypothetical protein